MAKAFRWRTEHEVRLHDPNFLYRHLYKFDTQLSFHQINYNILYVCYYYICKYQLFYWLT